MRNLLGLGAAAPTRVDTDRVVPLRWFDDNPFSRAFVTYTTFVVDDVLDPLKLRQSLAALAERDGWRRLGARLGRDSRGWLEYHMPTEFTSQRPALEFHHVEHAMPMADHPVASKLPRTRSRAAIVANPDDFHTLSLDARSPRTLDDYLCCHRPQLGLRVLTFADATLVTVHAPHTLFDGMGQKALLDAWSLMLQGREEDVPGTYPDHVDPLAELGRHPTEPHKLARYLLSWFDLVLYIIFNLSCVLFPDLQRRTICVPASTLASLRQTAMRELAANNEDATTPPPFLSEGDVLCAWWAQLSVVPPRKGSTRLVAINNALSTRPTLSRDLLSFSSTYVSNAVKFITVLLPAAHVEHKPLSFVASEIRQGVVDFQQRAQVEAYCELWRASRYRLIPLFGSSTMQVMTCTNWSKARLFETDFSAAVKPGPSASRAPSRVGKPRYVHHCICASPGVAGPNVLVIVGKDQDGTYWLDGCLSKDEWRRVERSRSQLEV